MLCILYVIAIGTLLGVAGLLAEQVLPPTLQRRWLWCTVIVASLFVPGYYRVHHNVAVANVLGRSTAVTALAAAHSVPAIRALDPEWWARVESYDASINVMWRIASAALVLWGLTGAWRVWGTVRASRTSRRAGRPSVLDGVPIIVTSTLGPATVGLWRARVLLPRWVLGLPRAQRDYVIRHEDEHRRSHDADLLFLASLTLVLAPWNLALWWQLRRLHLAIEMDCDARVVAALGDATTYGETLLAVAQMSGGGPRLQPAFLGGAGMLERRLIQLMHPAPARRAQRFLLPIVALGLLVVALATPHPIVEHGAAHAPGTHVRSPDRR